MTGIIPRFLLEAIAANGTPSQQIAARRTLEIDSQIRAEREAAATARSEPVAPAHRPRPHKNRKVYSAGQGLVRSEGQGPSGDVGVDEAYDGFGDTFDLYWDIYGRNSLDDDGQDLIALVHNDREHNNASWNGTQVLFGDGDGEIFKRFTLCVDVIGHELTHGVIQAAAAGKLPYRGQAGALNESISDVFGSLVKQRTLGQTAEKADWLIGAGMFVPEIDDIGVRSLRAAGTAFHDQPGIHGVALRSMSAPGTAFHDPVLIKPPLMPDGKDPQPDHMSRYVSLPEDDPDLDCGGVHINSGIPNRAFYLAATAIKGFAWEKAGRIWYHTLLKLPQNPDFQQFATLTALVAEELYRDEPEIRHMVVHAWHEVGLGGDALHLIVPDVRELRPALAASELQSLGLVPKFNGPNTAHSWVFSQSPLPGHWVALGSTVTMVLRTGPIP